MKTVLAAVCGVLLYSSVASAASVVVNCSTVTSLTELNQSISCAQFSGPGTLTSISIFITGSITGNITLTNNAATAQDVTATTSSAFNVGALTGFAFINPLFTASYTTGSVNLPAGGSQTFTGLTGSGNGTITNNTTFGPYVGAGAFLIPVSTQTGLTILGGGGQIASDQTTNASATAVVTYNFDEQTTVPEPATLVLLGSGLLGAAFRSRRRR